MLMKEFEILIWATLNSKDIIEKEKILEEQGPQKALLYRLLMTAFFLKEKFCKKDEFQAIKAYFIQNFPQFLGKYTTEWLLLAEPDISFITPKLINRKLIDLKDYHERLTLPQAASADLLNPDDDENL
jgi:hypothetical protein